MSRWTGLYCGPAPAPAELLLRWNFDPWAFALLLGLALWSARSRPGLAGVAILAIAFLSPLCALSSALFSARVLHHVLLVAVAAPLLAMARPARRKNAAGLPFLAATAALWLWHLPPAYDAALWNMAIYWLMQASLMITAWFFWRSVFSQPAGSGLGWVFLAYLQMGMLGAILTLTPNSLYAAHATAPLLWSLTPLSDQQLGGLIMWMPASVAYALWGALLARRAWSGLETAP